MKNKSKWVRSTIFATIIFTVLEILAQRSDARPTKQEAIDAYVGIAPVSLPKIGGNVHCGQVSCTVYLSRRTVQVLRHRSEGVDGYWAGLGYLCGQLPSYAGVACAVAILVDGVVVRMKLNEAIRDHKCFAVSWYISQYPIVKKISANDG